MLAIESASTSLTGAQLCDISRAQFARTPER